MISRFKSARKSQSHRVSIILSVFFIILFVILIGTSIVFTILAYPNVSPEEGTEFIDWFSTQVSGSYGMNIPFSILIQLITTISGVFFGIRIDQWITEKEEKEKLNGLWIRVNRFLKSLNLGIENEESISKLSEYRIYWDSIQRADEVATKFIQEDEKYIEISFAFSFLTYYTESWRKFDTIHTWELNSSSQTKDRINEWRNLIQILVKYTESKIIKS